MGGPLDPQPPAQPHLWLCIPKGAPLNNLVAMALVGHSCQVLQGLGLHPSELDSCCGTPPTGLLLVQPLPWQPGLVICDSPENCGV